jgi:hypothetical protein
MRNIINEGLDYHDMVNQMTARVTVDKYEAKMGDDDEIVTLAFIVKGQSASSDLVDWFERGYDWVLDAQVSDGEYTPGKYLVFVEIPRRTVVPDRIVELLADLETLTGIPVTEWVIEIDGEEYDADVEIIKQKLVLSPHQYRKEKETDLNEMRELSGQEPVKIYNNKDSILKDFLSSAGL